MSALGNLKKGTIPVNILLEYINLYRKIGKGEEIIKYLDENSKVYQEISNNDDAIYLFKMFNKDSKISDLRLNQIASMKDTSNAKNVDEQLLKNIRSIISIVNSNTTLIMDTTEIIDLSNRLYRGIPSLKNEFKKSLKNEISYRDRLDNIITEYNHITHENNSEYIYKSLSFLVDFLKLSPFKNGNEMIGIILFYSMMIDSDINSLKYVSFFKMLIDKEQEYNDGIIKAFYLYDEGYSDCFNLHKLMMGILNNSYEELFYLYKNIFFDKQLRKTSSIEGIIYKLDETFTKDDIRRMCPNVSLSTIDRTLSRMQDEGKISSFGRGRGSKWIRLDHSLDGTNINN